MKKTILYAPIHYILDAKNSGSEFSWSYELYEAFKKSELFNSIFITGGSRGLKDKRIIDLRFFSPEKLDLAIIHVLFFHFMVFIAGIKVLKKEKISIIHHILPFGLGTSFNLLAIFSLTPVIIGPIQPPLTVFDTDVDTSDALGTKNEKKAPFTGVQTIIFSFLKPFFRIFFYITVKKAKHIIVVNKKTKRLAMKLGVPSKKITIIPPGIDTKKFPFIPFSKKDKNITYILTVGHLRERKGVDMLIKAVALIIRKKKNIQLHIVGDGPQRGKLENLIKELELQQYVSLEGFVSYQKVPQYYKKAHIFVNMSKSEGFATISLEAMASGLPIISSKVGGFEDIITDGENGYLVEINDYTALAEKLLYFITHKKTIETFAKRGRELIEKEYEWDTAIIPQYIKLYKTL